MSEQAFHQGRMEQLLDALLDERISDLEHDELAVLLQHIPEARRYYCNMVGMHVLMQVEHAAPLEIAVTPSTTVIHRLASGWSRLGGASRAIAFGISGLLIVYFALLVFAVVRDQTNWANRGDERSSSLAPLQYAKVSKEIDCEWHVSKSQVASHLPSADRIHVQRGLVELKFDQGASVTIEGPAEFELLSLNSGYLKAGRIIARVPPEAVGFAVETPTSRIVDLGTEFDVAVDESGATDVLVTKGSVELHPGTKQSDSSSTQRPITLTAGSARRIEVKDRDGQVIVREIAPTANRLARSSAAPDVRPIAVQGAVASSTHPLLNVYDLINGSGLKGGRHSAAWEHTMWHTAHERVKDEFVLFDLFRPRRLNSMKVWNFNDATNGRYAWIGVKQADIYVSTSGQGDPLSQPGEWKLVIADQQFTPGTGLPDYDTPTIVALNDVEGRYVAIVIEDAWGYGPHPTDPSPNVVGLSEVQFFESRVNSHKPDVKPSEK